MATSCLKPPEYPETPSIEFKSVRVERITPTDGSTPFFKPIVTISFKDGDGDLGIPDNQQTYAPPFDYNYFIEIFIRNPQSGAFEPLIPGSTGVYDSRFPPLAPTEDKKAPLRGDLEFSVNSNFNVVTYTGAQLRFTVRIRDRALNESNTITTDILTLR
ncbi:hypothetical protein GCM10023186_18400 [Hymenobacter koreensis]|uniref:DUF3872 domain-containing protein n=2 Tax=Hymenobacter koreensis TaxID=1084523 RepID=A0ABP8IYD8_9BACT